MTAELYTIALEEHFATPAIFSRTAHVPGPLTPESAEVMYPKLLELGDQRIAAMDAMGVDLQVISHTAPGMEHVVEDAAALAREANDVLLEAISRYPDRFAGFATLPVNDLGAVADELRRCVGLGMHGALVNGTADGRFLDDPNFDDLLTVAQELDVPLYVHPGVPPIAIRQAYYSGFSDRVNSMLSTSAWGWHAETAVHVLRIVLAGVFDRHPGLQVIIGHMGEMLPVMIDRATSLLDPISGLDKSVRDYLTGNVHLTVAGLYSPPAFSAAVQTFGIDRLMFSTDYPYVPGMPARNFLETVPLAPADRRRLAAGNATALLRLPARSG